MVRGPRTMNLTPATRRTRPRRWPGVAAWVLWALTMLGVPVIAWLLLVVGVSLALGGAAAAVLLVGLAVAT